MAFKMATNNSFLKFLFTYSRCIFISFQDKKLLKSNKIGEIKVLDPDPEHWLVMISFSNLQTNRK
jgi:hypothetical protein